MHPAAPSPRTGTRLRIDVWADVACPWCYIGKRRLENAVKGSGHAGNIDLVLRTFELDPAAPVEPVDSATWVAEHVGIDIKSLTKLEGHVALLAAQEGLPFSRHRVHANSLDALRLLHLARRHDAANEVMGALQAALFSGRADVYAHEYMTETAVRHGVPRDEVLAVLETDRFTHEVREDGALARGLGATGVPFVVLDDAYAIPGVASTDSYSEAIATAWGNR